MTVCIDPPGRYDAWGYAIRGDPERPEILRQIPRVRSDRRLRRAVMGIAAIGGRCGPSDRAFREDLPGALSLMKKRRWSSQIRRRKRSFFPRTRL